MVPFHLRNLELDALFLVNSAGEYQISEVYQMTQPENKNYGQDMQYPPPRFEQHEPPHLLLLLPEPVSQSIHDGQGRQMDPPPAHIGVAEKPALVGHFGAGQAIQVEKGLTYQEFCPQDDYVREQGVQD